MMRTLANKSERAGLSQVTCAGQQRMEVAKTHRWLVYRQFSWLAELSKEGSMHDRVLYYVANLLLPYV